MHYNTFAPSPLNPAVSSNAPLTTLLTAVDHLISCLQCEKKAGLEDHSINFSSSKNLAQKENIDPHPQKVRYIIPDSPSYEQHEKLVILLLEIKARLINVTINIPLKDFFIYAEQKIISRFKLFKHELKKLDDSLQIEIAAIWNGMAVDANLNNIYKNRYKLERKTEPSLLQAVLKRNAYAHTQSAPIINISHLIPQIIALAASLKNVAGSIVNNDLVTLYQLMDTANKNQLISLTSCNKALALTEKIKNSFSNGKEDDNPELIQVLDKLSEFIKNPMPNQAPPADKMNFTSATRL